MARWPWQSVRAVLVKESLKVLCETFVHLLLARQELLAPLQEAECMLFAMRFCNVIIVYVIIVYDYLPTKQSPKGRGTVRGS